MRVGQFEKFTKLTSHEDNSYDEEEHNKFDFRSPKFNKILYLDRQQFEFHRKDSILDREYTDLNYESDEDDNETLEKNKRVEKELNENDKIIFASLYLPYQVVKNGEKWEIVMTKNPFYSTLCKLFQGRKNFIWIGLLKHYHEIEKDQLEELLIQLQRLNMYVVKLSEQSYIKLKRIISSILEPFFHYITLSDNQNWKNFEDLWKTFKEFNEAIAKLILTNLTENSLVFLHDYHLLLTASFIYNNPHFNNKNKKNFSIGLFIHSAFPSHDIFRRFPYREEMLDRKSVV